MVALVAVMILVSISTFQWRSLADMRTYPKSAALIMAGTVVVTVTTHDLAKGVLTGVVLTALSFARRASAMLQVENYDLDAERRIYDVKGEVFFASATQFVNSFDYLHSPKQVRIDGPERRRRTGPSGAEAARARRGGRGNRAERSQRIAGGSRRPASE